MIPKTFLRVISINFSNNPKLLEKTQMDSKVLGILGGGQLGLMMVEAATRLGVKTVVLDAANAPAKKINAAMNHIDGSFKSPQDVEKLAKVADVLTIEIEHVNTDILKKLLEDTRAVSVWPLPETIELIQDKYLQKEALSKHGVPVAKALPIDNTANGVVDAGKKLGFPYFLKARKDAYDGRGNYVMSSSADAKDARGALGEETMLYGEKFVPFTKELAVMVVRTVDGEVFSYPTVETTHVHSVLNLVHAPARVSTLVQETAQKVARDAVATYKGAGIFGVEMFLLANGDVLVNEVAPRPHNSGHYTLNACVTSQFEALVRAVVGLPLPARFSELSTTTTNCIMLNILGGATKNEELETCHRALATPGASVYLYGKESRPGRKVGHVNIIGNSMAECEAKLDFILSKTDSLKLDKQPQVGIIMGSDSDLPVMADACRILEKFGVPFEVSIVSAHRTPGRMQKYAEEAPKRGLKVIVAGAGGAAHLPGMVAAMTPLPVIGVPVKGSRLDGVDSLYSIVQMPRGVPVATVAINNSTNAALLAVRMLSVGNSRYLDLMSDYMAEMEKQVMEKVEKIEEQGWEGYLSGM